MAQATTTIGQRLNSRPASGVWFAATQTLFNQIAACYFSVTQANALVLVIGNQGALTALEQLTRKTKNNPNPVMPLSEVAQDCQLCFAGQPFMPLLAYPIFFCSLETVADTQRESDFQRQAIHRTSTYATAGSGTIEKDAVTCEGKEK